jgi:hypothetical protein
MSFVEHGYSGHRVLAGRLGFQSEDTPCRYLPWSAYALD